MMRIVTMKTRKRSARENNLKLINVLYYIIFVFHCNNSERGAKGKNMKFLRDEH